MCDRLLLIRPLSLTPLLCKSVDWFLYDIGLPRERLNDSELIKCGFVLEKNWTWFEIDMKLAQMKILDSEHILKLKYVNVRYNKTDLHCSNNVS